MKYLLAFSVFCFSLFFLNGQSLYDPFTIQEIQVTFPFSNWDQKLDSLHAADSDARLIATKLVLNGQQYDSVGIRYKGNSTYNANRLKNPLNIKLDFIKGKQDYEGFTTLKLSNGFMDPSFLREVMGYKIAAQYLPCAQANFIKVYINGAYNGLYTNVRAIDNDFLSTNYYSTNGAFFQCDRPDKQVTLPSSCNPPNAGSALRLGSLDTLCYANSYEIQSNYGWKELLSLMQILNNNPAQVISILDVDRALWMLALNNFYANFDSYSGSGHNYLVYQDANSRFNTIPWDYNEFYGAFTNGGTGNLSIQQMIELSPTFHLSNVDRPLISKLLSISSWKKRYLAHLFTILKDAENNKGYESFGKSMQGLISQSVLADKNKFFTDAAFQSNLTSDFTNTGGMGTKTYPGLITFTNSRINYLKTTAEYKAIAPTISEEKYTPSNVTYNSSVTFTTKCSNASTVNLYYRFAPDQVFQSIQMFDDGQHQDNVANDGIYGTQLPIAKEKSIQYYFFAENSNAAKLSPERAEYEFFKIQITPKVKLENEIKLNELMASNINYIKDQDNEYDDWIELYNTTSNDLLIQGLYLSDNRENLLKYEIKDTIIKKQNYICIWADENGNQQGLHANFKLSKTGESVYLSRYDGLILDSVSYKDLPEDQSYTLCGSQWKINALPSFGEDNACSSTSTNNHILDIITIFPNPFENYFILSKHIAEPITIQVYNSLGGLVESIHIVDSVHKLSTKDWSRGIYFVKSENGMSSRIICKI